MDKPITNTEIETEIWKLSTNKSPGPGDLTSNFYQTFREKLTPMLLKFFFFFLSENIYLFIYFYFFNFFNFTILYLFCHVSTWICHRYTRVPHPEPFSLLPPHTIPLGHPSAPASSIQYHALNLDWRLISYMILYIFNAILPNHPTLSLSHRVQKTVLYISVSFAVSYTGLLLPSF